MATKTRSITGLAVEFGRKAKWLSRDELAELLAARTGNPWSYHAVHRMETGTRKVSAQELVALAEVLDLPYSFLLEGPRPALVETRTGSR
jgi:transcriptional regulator with XRE-family HTH domain